MTAFTEGWDFYPNNRATWNTRWPLYTANGDDAIVAGRFSGQAWQSQYSDGRRTTLPTAAASGSYGFAYRQNSGFSGATIASLWESGTEHLRFGVNLDGSVYINRAGTGLGAGSTSVTGLLATTVWAYIEIVYTIADSTGGSVQVWVNGSKVIDLTGIDTRNGGTSGVINQVSIVAAGTGRFTQFDDIYHVDGARWGEGRIETLFPNADTAQKDWTPNSGSTDYTQVDESNGYDSDTTYVSSNTVGHKDTYGLANLSTTPAAIKAVTPVVVARKDDATTREIRTGLKSGSTTANGATRALSAGYMIYHDTPVELDPDTAAAWTASGVNGLQQNIEVVT